ncbi:relaxase/mobilization nuclease domain-containing protein [Sphingomonas sp. NPDC079357]|uniref:relaxase/mobilization nuclease domain-containing protein n=1 Tax=Sphingomonas sp. NPDC079357 TaxID=3364518 RepID=UPI0038515612
MVIIEKQAKGGGKQAARYCRSLADYMRTAKSQTLAHEYGITLATYMRRETDKDKQEDSGQRVLATGALVGGSALDFDAAQLELELRLAKRSKRSKKAARHLVSSYRAGEEPNADGCAEVALVLADELGCKEGVILWALHGDTDNRHLHLLILTLDEQGQATPFGPRGQSHEAMQRAIARIEHAQQLTPEQGSRYVADENGVRRRSQLPPRIAKRAPIGSEILRWEKETGLESFTRYAQDVLAPILDKAESWAEAQAGCAEKSAVVRKAGSGGELQSADALYKVKLSNVDRKLSWAPLTRRWGDWSEPDVEIRPYTPRVLDPAKAAAWAEAEERRSAAHDAVQRRIDRLRAEKAAAVEALGDELAARRADIVGLELAPGSRAGMVTALDAMYATRLTGLKADYDGRIAAVRELRDEVDACGTPGHVDLAGIGRADLSLSLAWSRGPAVPVAHSDYRAVVVGQSVQYWATAGHPRRPAFVERGDRIWINDESDAALTAALMVAKARYGDVAAHGDPAFIRRAQALGRQIGMVVQDGEAVAPPPPRHRSPRAGINRAAARAAGQAALRRAAMTRAAQSAIWKLLSRDHDDERRTSLPLEVAGMPPNVPLGAESMDAATAARYGLVFSPQPQPGKTTKPRGTFAELAHPVDEPTGDRGRVGDGQAHHQPRSAQWSSAEINRDGRGR